MQREWKQCFGNWSKEEWIEKYNNLQGQLITDYLRENPEIMQQKIVVFPMNAGGDHWVTTFVFNPGNVQSKQGSLRTCFFRYCSLQPDGDRKLNMNMELLGS